MATTVFNLSAIDRIETDVKDLQATQVDQTAAINALSKIISDFIAELGGGDQPAVDAAATALQSLTSTLSSAVDRDKAPE
jgi:hypothetical protein